MKKILKRGLYKALGQNNYLKLLRKSFFFIYGIGYLKNDEIYKFHYFVKNLIHEGDYVLDLGANLGYFSKIFSRLVGAQGKVICIEPVKPFFKILSNALKNKKNIVLYNYALGLENKTIEMVLPKMDGYIRTGLAHVPTAPPPDNETHNENDNYIFNVKMMRGSELLKALPRLDYIKCDIEGYEEYVVPELKNIIETHKPLIQIETWNPHKNKVFEFLYSLGFSDYALLNNKLVKEYPSEENVGDYLFVHQSKEKIFIEELRKKNLV